MEPFHCYSSFPSSSPPPLAEGWCQSLGVLNLTHLAVNRGSIYLAGGSILCQLDQDLLPSQTVGTDPLLDSHQCGAGSCSSDTHSNSSLVRTDSFNKVLAVDRRDDKLVVCGSVKQGSCTKCHLSDISSAHEAVVEAIAANREEGSTFAFIGPQQYNPWSNR